MLNLGSTELVKVMIIPYASINVLLQFLNMWRQEESGKFIRWPSHQGTDVTLCFKENPVAYALFNRSKKKQ